MVGVITERSRESGRYVIDFTVSQNFGEGQVNASHVARGAS